MPVVEEHQGGEAEADTSECTITLRYTPGWAWIYTFVYDDGVGVRQGRDGGFPSREAAKFAAENAADDLARSLRPAETYTYTPKLED